ncbi:MAG: MBL fold metallo-hydrolase [Acetobacteraceae bacterium]|nr:MBL fold metallo-hydrolase [Acetobacteraceae bacterium]
MTVPDQQIPGVIHRRVGELFVTALSDGFLDGSLNVLRNIGEEEAAAMIRAAFRPVPRRTSVNCFLIRGDDATTLVDTGCGDTMQPTTGKLLGHLAAAGVAPEAIDLILLTHMHGDHSNGLSDASGRAVFPNATVTMHEAEWAYWSDSANVAEVERTGNGLPYFAMAQRQMAPYLNRLRTFRDGEVAPGITAVPLPGHTPGHTGYRVASEGESLLIWGDITHVPEVQIPRPDVTVIYDVDPAQAEASRRRILEQTAADRQLVAGMHLHFPGYAHVAQDAGGYRLVPEPWRQAL